VCVSLAVVAWIANIKQKAARFLLFQNEEESAGPSPLGFLIDVMDRNMADDKTLRSKHKSRERILRLERTLIFAF